MDPFTIGAALVKFAPTIAGWFGGDDAEGKVQAAVDIAKQVTGNDNPETAIATLEKNPELALQFEKAVMAKEVAMEKEKTRRIEAVNATMQAEAKSEHWMQWSWRPFNGFLFGITLFFGYIILPMMDKDAISLPEFVLMAWAAVLGVTAWHRGMHKREADGGGRKAGAASNFQRLLDRTVK